MWQVCKTSVVQTNTVQMLTSHKTQILWHTTPLLLLGLVLHIELREIRHLITPMSQVTARIKSALFKEAWNATQIKANLHYWALP